MSISKRQNQILELLSENGFLTVENLSRLPYISQSSIRRDLAHLANLSLVRRTHGGAESVSELGHTVPLYNRMSRNIAEKRKIARSASVFLKDGQTVMLDGSSTAGYLVPYIAKHKNMTVFTNNMLTAISSLGYGIETYCLGGRSVDNSEVLSGEPAYSAVSKIYPDILFFSSKSLDRDGVISDPIREENYLRELMLKNARFKVFLCDKDKFETRSLYRLCELRDIDACVFDRECQELSNAGCRVIW